MTADPIHDFLAAAGWGEAQIRPLAGDASNRRYHRLHRGGETAVLMDAAPERGEDVRPFLAIARHLSALGLSAPGVLAADATRGLLLQHSQVTANAGDRVFKHVAGTFCVLNNPQQVTVCRSHFQLFQRAGKRHRANTGRRRVFCQYWRDGACQLAERAGNGCDRQSPAAGY